MRHTILRYQRVSSPAPSPFHEASPTRCAYLYVCMYVCMYVCLHVHRLRFRKLQY